ncbi:hypothetical protein [Nostoc sp. PCC 9305]
MIIRQFLALAAISLTLAACGQAGSNPNLTAQNPLKRVSNHRKGGDRTVR